MKELIEIQNELTAPKSQYNKFGKYSYRSAEDILEALKPLLKKNNCTLKLTDRVEMIGERYYIVATATLKNSAGETEEATAYAREDNSGPNGMQVAQLSGSTSSYARKYALNGLFCIDDNKDPDATNTHGKETIELKETTELEEAIELGNILAEIRSAKNENELKTAWNKHKDKDKHYNNKIKAVVNEMGDKLGLTKK